MKALRDSGRWLAALMALAAGIAAAADGGDHPLLGRYEGAEQVGRHVTEFDEVELIDGPIDGTRGADAPGWLHLEGASTLLYYRLPAGRSSLEVLRNYQGSLERGGFRTLFACATGNGSCYRARPGRTTGTAPFDFALAFDANPELPRLDGDFIRNYFGTQARHLLARRDGPEGAVYVSLTIAEHARGNHLFARVVETRAMQSDKIAFVDADAMRRSIADSGRVSLYGIQFDFDQDSLREDSQPTLQEIVRLLHGEPGLRLTIVGHTDAQGGAAYNRDLSRRRAERVSAWLVGQGVAAARLEARGAGADQPVASNADEDGRARNRRVELIRRP